MFMNANFWSCHWWTEVLDSLLCFCILVISKLCFWIMWMIWSHSVNWSFWIMWWMMLSLLKCFRELYEFTACSVLNYIASCLEMMQLLLLGSGSIIYWVSSLYCSYWMLGSGLRIAWMLDKLFLCYTDVLQRVHFTCGFVDGFYLIIMVFYSFLYRFVYPILLINWMLSNEAPSDSS